MRTITIRNDNHVETIRPASPDAPVTPPPAPRDMTITSPEERLAFLKDACQRAGIRLPETRVTEGEALIEVGVEKLRKLEAEVDALPTLREAADALAAREALERPASVEVAVRDLRMDPKDGSITRGGGSLNMTHRGLSQILDFAAPSVRAPEDTLAHLSPDTRSRAFNELVSKAPNRKIVLQTRKPMGGHRMVEAATSDRYAVLGDAALLTGLAAQEHRLGAGAKCRVTISPEGRVDVEIFWPTMKREIRVGDILTAGARISHAHFKQAGISSEAQVLRVLCYNLTTGTSVDDNATRMRHTGDPRALLANAVRATLDAAKRVEPLVLAFGESYRLALAKPRADTVADLVKARRGWNDFGQPMATATLAAWDADGSQGAGDTLGGLANAITRASQAFPLSVATGAEALAGALIQRQIPVMLAA